MVDFQTSVPLAYVDETGCHIPTFEAVLAGFKADYAYVYGQDIYLEPDSQDGELVGIQAKAYYNLCASFLQAYNSFSPTTAQGTGLSSIVKLNGIARTEPSYSTADLRIVGVYGTVITNGRVSDGTNSWALPATVTIPIAGEIVATATCLTLGAVAGRAGTINQISTPTRGWQEASNTNDAAVGAPVESDAHLRVRQTFSTELPALGILDGVSGGVANLTGVTRLAIFENDKDYPDPVTGIPGHSISVVVTGGTDSAIAAIIQAKKGAAGTYGTTSAVVYNAVGVPQTVSWFRVTDVQITWKVTVRTLVGYTSDVELALRTALAAWTANLGIGRSVLVNRGWAPAALNESPAFELVGLAVARDGGLPAAADVPLQFFEAAACTSDNIVVVVVP